MAWRTFTDKDVKLTAAELELIFDYCTNEIDSIEGGESSYGTAEDNDYAVSELKALKEKLV